MLLRSFLSLCLTVALLSALPAGASEDTPAATVRLSGPTEMTLGLDEATTLAVHVSGRAVCTRGLDAPRDLVITPAAHDAAGRSILIDPERRVVSWRAAPAEAGVYVINALAGFNVSAIALPLRAPLETYIRVEVEEVEDNDTTLRCDVSGYTLDVYPHLMSLQVVPDGSMEGSSLPEPEPPVRVAPILLAVMILSGLAAFAGIRERQRRQRDG